MPFSIMIYLSLSGMLLRFIDIVASILFLFMVIFHHVGTPCFIHSSTVFIHVVSWHDYRYGYLRRDKSVKEDRASCHALVIWRLVWNLKVMGPPRKF